MAGAGIENLYEQAIGQLRAGRPEQALPLLTLVVEAKEVDFGRREHARMLQGYALAQRDDWAAAAGCFKTATVNDGQCLPARTALGHAYLMLGRIAEAIEVFRLTVQLAPENAQARHGLGWALLEEGRDLDEARYQVQEAQRLAPDSAAIRDSLAWALFRLGDVESAAEQMAAAIRLDPDHPVILAHWREIKAALKKQEESRRKA